MELRDYLNVIRTRKWTIVQAMVIVTVTAVVVGLVQPSVYEGQAKVLISESDSGAALFGSVLPEFSSQPERGLQTQVQLMQLRPLAEATVRSLGLEMTPDRLLEEISVQAVGQTNIVTISVRDGSAEGAAAIANSLAEGYVTWSRDIRRESIRAAADEVQVRLQEAQDQVLELGRRIQREGKSDDLAAELQIATGSYTTLAEKLEQLLINEQLESGSGRVVSAAIVSFDPVAPSPLRNGLLGLIVGLVLGLGMAFLHEYLDDTIKSTEEAEKIFGAPVLGTIPLEKFEKGIVRRLAVLESPGSSAAESYRVLRNSLDFINFEHDLKTLLVTSAAPGEGKSTVSANLAASLAQAGKKVVHISSDFRRPTIDQFFNVNNTIGLSDVLTGAHSLKAALQRPGDEQLLVLNAGKLPPNPSELLASAKMEALVSELEDWADWIIIDSPPLLAVADPATVVRWVDGVLVVSQAGHSSRDASHKAVELLGKVGAKIIGTAIWGLEEGRTGAGYGYYAGGHYYYANYYGKIGVGASRSEVKSAEKNSTHPDARLNNDAGGWLPPMSPGRQMAATLGRVLSGALAFLLVLAVTLAVAYFLDGYFDWGLVGELFGLL